MSKLRAHGKEAVDIKNVLLLTTTSIMSAVMFNERLDHEDPRLIELKNLVMTFFEVLSDFTVIDLVLPPWMAKLFNRSKLQKFKTALEGLEDYIAKRVDEHRASVDPANPRDFIDMYLGKPDLEVGKGFYDTIIAFLPDAIDSISVFMRWIVLYVAYHPEVQKKAQAEIDEIVGESQMASSHF